MPILDIDDRARRRSATLRIAWSAPFEPRGGGTRLIAGREDEELPPEHPRVDRVCSRTQQTDGHAVQDKHGDMETMIAPAFDENSQLNEAGCDRAIGRQ